MGAQTSAAALSTGENALNSSVREATVNGLTQAWIETGEGEPLLLLHGFPDTPHTWAGVTAPLVTAGYRVVMPFLRGYPPSRTAPGDDYSALRLGEDVLGWLDLLGVERGVVVGHDWGAFAAYAAANLQPHRVRKLVTLAIPHPGSLRMTPRALWRSRHFVTFQWTRRALARLRRDNLEGIRELCREWSPAWKMTDAELDVVRQTLGPPGALEAALGYYRSFRRDALGPRGREVRRVLQSRTRVPTLSFFGEKDGALDVSGIQRTREWFEGRYEVVSLPDVGHFIHREAPDLFVARTLDFLSA